MDNPGMLLIRTCFPGELKLPGSPFGVKCESESKSDYDAIIACIVCYTPFPR